MQVVIGVDPHKYVLSAAALDERGWCSGVLAWGELAAGYPGAAGLGRAYQTRGRLIMAQRRG